MASAGAFSSARLDAVPEQTAKELDRVRLKLVDAAAELKPPSSATGDLAPMPTMDELVARVRHVARELHDIESDLLMVIHVMKLESGDFNATLEEIDRKLESGWIPEPSPVDAVIARLKAARPA